jgi:hypothetical protein
VGNGSWTAAAHGEQRVAGVEEGGGGGKGGKWVECRLLVLLGRRGREEEQA